MAHNRKAKEKGVSASSFFDFKADVLQKQQEIALQKASGKSTTITGVVRPKKSTKWSKANKGVKDRHAKDLEQEARDRPTIESSRARLQEKAEIYDKLSRGKTAGLSEARIESLQVDFASKPINDRWESDSEDIDESLTVPRPPMNADDEMVEYTDDFGRTRLAPRSEVPRQFLKNTDEEEIDDDTVISNPVNHFPTYDPDAARLAQIAEASAEYDKPLETHYDSSLENRARGAGAYSFSRDEKERLAQQERLNAARDETMRARAEAGAVDVKPGEVEGFDSDAGSSISRAKEKRKREIEERRKALEAKRQKLRPTEDVSQARTRTEDQQPAVFMASTNDPFAALEAASSTPSTDLPVEKKGKAKVVHEADVFLAQLESEMLKKRAK